MIDHKTVHTHVYTYHQDNPQAQQPLKTSPNSIHSAWLHHPSFILLNTSSYNDNAEKTVARDDSPCIPKSWYTLFTQLPRSTSVSKVSEPDPVSGVGTVRLPAWKWRWCVMQAVLQNGGVALGEPGWLSGYIWAWIVHGRLSGWYSLLTWEVQWGCFIWRYWFESNNGDYTYPLQLGLANHGTRPCSTSGKPVSHYSGKTPTTENNTPYFHKNPSTMTPILQPQKTRNTSALRANTRVQRHHHSR